MLSKEGKNHNRLLTIVACIGVVMSHHSYAMQEISEDELSQTTGEGIAFLPENFFIRTNDGVRTSTGAYDTSDTSKTKQVLDAGYIRIIPVGTVSPERKTVGFDKADLYLYGFSYSQSEKLLGEARTLNTDENTKTTNDLYSGFGKPIDSWGTSKNPWVLQTETEKNVPGFNKDNKKNLSYFGINAPDFDKTVYEQAKADIAAGKYDPIKYAAYNLKMSWWGDIFKRDSEVVENQPNDLTNRTRLNATWDGVTINGTNLRIFQTRDGADTPGIDLPASYNNTFGMSAMLRINGGDSSELRAKVDENVEIDTRKWTVISDGGGNGVGYSLLGTNWNRERVYSGRLKRTKVWTLPEISSVLQLSTREIGTEITNDLSTPARGGVVPQFDPTSGIFMYNPNINVPLGQLYQPLMIDTKGNNLSLELARIPNNPDIYRLHNQQYKLNDYERWTGLGSANSIVGEDSVGTGNYLGRTCNFNECGETVTIDGVTQFKPATHGSITIGSTVYDSSKNHTSAYKGEGAIGVSFGKLRESKTLNQDLDHVGALQYQRRREDFFDWRYLYADGWGPRVDQNNWDTANATWFNFGDSAPGVLPDLLGRTPTTETKYADSGFRNYNVNEIKDPTLNTSPINNLGSVAIDGVSIQYYKLSTTN